MVATDAQANVTKGSTSVDILLKSIEHGFDKQLLIKPIPEEESNLTYLVDLKRLREAITIVGILEDTDTESALTKKNNLRTIMQSKGTMTLTWGAGALEQSFTVNISKALIKEVPGRIGPEGSQNKTFEINITFIIGTHRG